MTSILRRITAELELLSNPEKAKILSRFFKTGKGEYGEGDIFLGIMVPEQRKVAKKYQTASLNDLHKLISDKIHEHRFVALLILTEKYNKADLKGRKSYYAFYIDHLPRINNWDLVDVSADSILGDYLLDEDTAILSRLSESDSFWERRISIMATFAFIKKNRFADALKIAELLVHDRHDLIHKAVGWMLREIGKRDQAIEESFLRTHYTIMPRTMLRYAIEKFDKKRRQFYLNKKY